MKTIILVVAVMALAVGSSQARSRFVREAEGEAAAAADPPAPVADVATPKEGEHSEDNFIQTVTKGLSLLRKNVNENLAKDVDKLQSAMTESDFAPVLERVRERMKDNAANFRSIMQAFREEATPQYKEVIERIQSQASPVFEKFQSRIEQQRKQVQETAMSALAAISDAIKDAAL